MKQTRIKKIVLEIDGKEIALGLDEARQLQGALNEMFERVASQIDGPCDGGNVIGIRELISFCDGVRHGLPRSKPKTIQNLLQSQIESSSSSGNLRGA